MAKRVRKELLLLVPMRWHVMWSNLTRLQLSHIHRGNIKTSDVTTMLCHGSVVSISPRRLGFSPGLVHVGFVLEEVALRRILLRVLRSYFCEYQCICAVCLFVCRQQQLTASVNNTLKKICDNKQCTPFKITTR